MLSLTKFVCFEKSVKIEDQSLARLNEMREQEKERQIRLEEMKKEEERLLQEFKRLNTQYPKHPLVSKIH